MKFITVTSIVTVSGMSSTGSYQRAIFINPHAVSDIIENSGSQPACILHMTNGLKYDIAASATTLVKLIEDSTNDD